MKHLLLWLLACSILTAQTAGPTRGGAASSIPFVFPTQVGSAVYLNCGTQTSCTSQSFTSTAGDLFIVDCNYYFLGINPMSVVDSNGNTLAAEPQISFSISANAASQYSYILGESGGSVTFTCNFTNSVQDASTVVIQFHPGTITSLDASNTVNYPNVLSCNLSPTSPHINPSAQEFVVWGAIATGSAGTISGYGIGSYTTTQDSGQQWYYADATTPATDIYGFFTASNCTSWGLQIFTFH